MRPHKHSPAAAKVMGIFLLSLAVLCLATGYATRKAGVFGMLFQFGGAYLTIHGTGLLLESEGPMTMRKGLLLVGVLALLGIYFLITSADASIWG
jgi:uncharacterized membrane protein YphA (DoxX/SURF4 family)